MSKFTSRRDDVTRRVVHGLGTHDLPKAYSGFHISRDTALLLLCSMLFSVVGLLRNASADFEEYLDFALDFCNQISTTSTMEEMDGIIDETPDYLDNSVIAQQAGVSEIEADVVSEVIESLEKARIKSTWRNEALVMAKNVLKWVIFAAAFILKRIGLVLGIVLMMSMIQFLINILNGPGPGIFLIREESLEYNSYFGFKIWKKHVVKHWNSFVENKKTY